MVCTQVACKVVLDEALKLMEDEMATMDEEERVDNPPRYFFKKSPHMQFPHLLLT